MEVKRLEDCSACVKRDVCMKKVNVKEVMEKLQKEYGKFSTIDNVTLSVSCNSFLRSTPSIKGTSFVC